MAGRDDLLDRDIKGTWIHKVGQAGDFFFSQVMLAIQGCFMEENWEIVLELVK